MCWVTVRPWWDDLRMFHSMKLTVSVWAYGGFHCLFALIAKTDADFLQ